MPILGIVGDGDFSSVDVSARAVAEAKVTVSTGGGFAIFSLESCPSLEKSVDISGSTIPITGSVHSNSDIYVSGSVVFINGETT